MAKVRKRTWRNSKGEQTAWIADYFDQAGKRHIKTFDPRTGSEGLAGDGTGRGRARRPHRGECQHHGRRGGRAMDRERKARMLGALDSAAIPQPRRPAYQAAGSGEKLARLSAPTIEAFRDDLLRKGSRPMARKVLASLKGILGEAQRRGLVAQNAAQPVKVDVKKRDQAKLAVGRDIPCKEEFRRSCRRRRAAGGRCLLPRSLPACGHPSCAGSPGMMLISSAR